MSGPVCSSNLSLLGEVGVAPTPLILPATAMAVAGNGGRPRTTSSRPLSSRPLPFSRDPGDLTNPSRSRVIIICSCASFLSRCSCSSACLSNSSSFLCASSSSSLDSLSGSSESGEVGRNGAVSGPARRLVPCSVAVDEEVVLPCIGPPRALDGDLCVNEFKRALTPSGVLILWLPESRRALRAAAPVSLLGGILTDKG